jgi:nitrogenase molybdenum-iron protein beta chain
MAKSRVKTDVVRRQTNSIVHPHYGCSIGASFTVLGIDRAIPIINCSPGCVNKQENIISGGNGYQGVGYGGGGAIPSVNIAEKEIVFGAAEKLDLLIKSTFRIMDGDLFVVLSGCVSELIGDDVASIVNGYVKKGKAIVYSEVPGFKGNNLYGHEQVIIDIVDQYVGDYPADAPKKKKLINLFTEVPYHNTFWRGDYTELKRILEGAGYKVNILFGVNANGVKEWKTIPKAEYNIVLSPWVGLRTAAHLEKKYGQKYLHYPIIPIGEEAVNAFVHAVLRFTGAEKAQIDKAEKFLAEEARIYYYYLEHFSEFFSEFWFGLPSKFTVVADATYNLAITKFLADQMGLIPIKQIITDNTPEEYREPIRALYGNITDGVVADVEFLEDGYVIEKELEAVDFGTARPFIFGTSWEADVAAKRDAALIRISPPVTDRLVVNKSYVGYRGALSLIETIYTAAVGGQP